MKIGETHKGCRYWGYEPALRDTITGTMTLPEKNAVRLAVKEQAATIKAAGLKPSQMGLRAKLAAIGAASKVEKATGIEMSVFHHDYL